MPYSDNSNENYIRYILKNLKPKTVLDVGAGAGKYSYLVRSCLQNVSIDAVEAWEPYIDQFDLHSRYDNIFLQDVRETTNFNYDLVILGDILEHMTKEEAQDLWDKISKQAQNAIISIPIIHFPQGHYEGNPYEEHIKDDWTHEEVLSSFSNIKEYDVYEITGTYLAKFKNMLY